MTEAIRCPGCGASGQTEPDGAGVRTCPWCGVQFHLPQAVPAPRAAPSSKPAPSWRELIVAGFVVAAIVVGIGATALVVGDAADDALEIDVDIERPEDPFASTPVEGLHFEEHERREASDGDVWILGYLRNDGTEQADKATVHAILLDAAGREVGVDRGSSPRLPLRPGEHVGLRILIDAPPAHADIRFDVEAERSPFFAQDPAEPLVLTPFEERRSDLGWTFSGTVRNDSDAVASFVQVQVQGWLGDTLLFADESYLDDTELEPGASSHFDVSVRPRDPPPDRIEYLVWGRR